MKSGQVSSGSLLYVLSIWLLSADAIATAFDGDFEINDIDMVEENFLDIKAHRFRKSMEDQWYDNISGWRMNGASLDGDFAFLQTEIKLQQELSDSVNVRLEVEQETFYAEKDFPAPTVEVEFYPLANDIGFSLLGTAAYEKRDMNLGAALIWGRRPWGYTRLEVLKVDAVYNEKSAFDSTEQTQEPGAQQEAEGHSVAVLGGPVDRRGGDLFYQQISRLRLQDSVEGERILR